ncbi:MAG: hypothetical protein U0793_14030 [Gemmataceae bacterium]
MRYGRIAFILALLALTGAWLVAQERREPWPPRPVVPPDFEEQDEPPSRPKAPRPTPVAPPSTPVFPPPALDRDLPPLPSLEKMDAPLPPPAPPPATPPAPKSSAAPKPAVFPTGPETPTKPTPAAFPTSRAPSPQPAPVAEPPPGPGLSDLPPPAPTPPPAPAPPPAPTPMAPAPTPTAPTLEAPPPAPTPKAIETPLPAPKKIDAPGPVVPPPIAEHVSPRAPSVPAAPTSEGPAKFRLLKTIHRADSTPPLAFAPTDSGVTTTRAIAVAGGTVIIEKRGPAHVKHTDPIPYVISVRNPTSVPLYHVRIEDEIPAPARILSANPPPDVAAGKPVWIVPLLGAGEEKQIRITLEVSQPGELETVARVFVPAGQSAVRTEIHPGVLPAAGAPGGAVSPLTPVTRESGLTVLVKAPSSAGIGAAVTFEIILHNTSRAPTGPVRIAAQMSEGLSHPEGAEIDADLKGLAGGAQETLKLSLKTTKPGAQSLSVQVRSADGQTAANRAQVMVGESALRLKQAAETRLIANRDGELAIEVANYQASGVRNLLVVDSLPAEVGFAGASDRGMYREESRSVSWLIDYLAPGESKTLKLKVRGRKTGEFSHEIVARSDAREEGRAQSKLRVEGLVDLAVDVKKRDDALELGKETVYEIQVKNQGSGPATGIQLAAAVPDGMSANRAEGPTDFRIEGRSLVFSPVRALAPGEKTSYYVAMTAQAAGDQRLRVRVASDQVATPITREERVFVYRDR